MAGISPSRTDEPCNTHNTLSNITNYASGVTFIFKDADNPPDMHYGVVSLQRCCDKVNAPLMRIPGNTGCEMQFCLVDAVTVETVEYAYTDSTVTVTTTVPGTATDLGMGIGVGRDAVTGTTMTTGSVPGSGVSTATTTGMVSATTLGTTIDIPEDLDNCLKFVYEGDLPDDISKDIAGTSWWEVVRLYDDEIADEDVRTAVLAASPAPPSWTSAVADPFGKWFSSSIESSASPTPTSSSETTPSSSSNRGSGNPTESSVKVWTMTAIVVLGLVIAF
ncbi:hypothetical protein F4678DRAFT_481828 [Xylaria arbuscula]|nr:hypothetical protein F4678DRAFT_481828 [Xylaria arbuscula]